MGLENLSKEVKNIPYEDQFGYEVALQEAQKLCNQMNEQGRGVSVEEGKFEIKVVEPRFRAKEKK